MLYLESSLFLYSDVVSGLQFSSRILNMFKTYFLLSNSAKTKL